MRRAAHVPSWWKSSRTVLQAGSVAKGGGNASPGVTGSGRGGGVEWAMRYGSGKWAPGQETPGMSACCLWCGSRGAPAVVVFLGLVAQDRAPTVRWGLKGLRQSAGP